MPGRMLCNDEEAMARGFLGQQCQRGREVLRQTIAAFQKADPADSYDRLGTSNLSRWREQATEKPACLCVEVLPGDWGEVTRSLTAKYGECFAVLNMANAHVPGGAYVEGAVFGLWACGAAGGCGFDAGGFGCDCRPWRLAAKA